MRVIRLISMAVIMGLVSLPAMAIDRGSDELKDPIEILNDQGKKLGELPAQRSYLPYEGVRADARLGVTKAGHVYVALGKKLYWSKDEGRTWGSRDLPVGSSGFDILRDDTFIVFSGYPKCGVVRSTDYGKTWSKKIPLDLSPFTTGGGGWTQITHPPGLPALMTVTLRHGDGKKKTTRAIRFLPRKWGFTTTSSVPRTPARRGGTRV